MLQTGFLLRVSLCGLLWLVSAGAGVPVTGPGGRGDTDQITHPNHHLHIKFAVRDESDGRWYLVDPYGIYGGPDCYPDDVEGKLSGYCVRYPVAWRDGRPERP